MGGIKLLLELKAKSKVPIEFHVRVELGDGDAAFANPKPMTLLENEGYHYAIRITTRQTRQLSGCGVALPGRYNGWALAEFASCKARNHIRCGGRSMINSSRSASKRGALPPKVQGYRAEPDKVWLVRQLALALAALSLFQVAPLLRQPAFFTAPGWTRAVVLVCAIELAYAIWVTQAPDWSSVRVLMLLAGLVAAAYALTLSIVALSPRAAPLALDLGPIRHEARLWCGAVLALTCLYAYVCGHFSFTWRRKYEKRHRLSIAGRPA